MTDNPYLTNGHRAAVSAIRDELRGLPVGLEALAEPFKSLALAIRAAQPATHAGRSNALFTALPSSGIPNLRAFLEAVNAPEALAEDEAPPDLDAPDDDAPELPEAAWIDPALGDGVGAWVDQYIGYAEAVSPMTPRTFHESAALWLTALGIARRLALRMPYDEIFPNLYVVWDAPSTLFRKTTALNIARKLARDVFPHLLAAQDTTPESFISDLAGKEPAYWEKMSLADQNDWAAKRNYSAQKGWVLDEISGLLAGAGRDYNAGLLEALLRLYDCDPHFTRSTRSQGWVTVRGSYLSILGASTPAALAAHLPVERLWGNGWWPRFAILTPETDRPEWREARGVDRPPALADGLKRLYNRLPPATWPNPPEAITVSLGAGTFDAWKAYNRALSFDLLTPELDRRLFGAYGRLPTHALKVAMILAALNWDTTPAPQIELTHLARAQAIAEEWRRSAHRALAEATASDFDRLQERITRQLSRHEPGGATLRNVYRAMRDKQPMEIENTLLQMSSAGLVEIVEVKTGGRPAKRYRLAKD
jgi:hypothetical protein